ncbi:MAG: 4Fe-4S dicluster domain-containing protein [Verrucomicrobia bacterium]|nr:4Fe-4S dicluster domain-containing protein [Verrucomicrobiota bacterium]
MAARQSDHYADVPLLPREMGSKKKTPRRIAEVEEGNCTGCQVCVPFCPVDCIEPVPRDKYKDTVIPPVHVRQDECIGCEICVRACAKLTWNAIQMVDIDEFEKKHGVTVKGPRYGWEGVEPDASHGPTASDMYDSLTKAGKIKFT